MGKTSFTGVDTGYNCYAEADYEEWCEYEASCEEYEEISNYFGE